MAEEQRRTTARSTSASSASHTTVETTRSRGIPSAVWLVVGAVLAVAVIFYLLNGGLTIS